MGVDWTKLLLAAGGTVAVGGVLWYLLRDEDPAKAEAEGEGSKGLAAGSSAASMTRDQVLELLSAMMAENQRTKEAMKVVAKELASNVDFQQAYKKVEAASKGEDPLQKAGISPEVFEQILERHQNDNEVRMRIMLLMQGGGGPPELAVTAKRLTKDKIVEIQTFMVAELEKTATKFRAVEDKTSLDIKAVALTAQAIVSARVLEVFSVTDEEFEASVRNNVSALQTDATFHSVAMRFQEVMMGMVGIQQQ